MVGDDTTTRPGRAARQPPADLAARAAGAVLIFEEPDADQAGAEDALAEDGLAQDLLVEEISIDGMCGVY